MRGHFILIAFWALVVSAIYDGTQHCSGCILEEKRALLDFKASLNVTHYYARFVLPSWTAKEGDGANTDCCSWERVKCSNTTGRIVELQLKDLSELMPGEYWNLNFSTFVPLKDLRALDLGGNPFREVTEFNRLTKLELLDLSGFGNLQGSLSFKELKLDNIKVLKLEDTQFDQLTDVELLTSLEVLALGSTGINDSSIIQAICSLKNLRELDLSLNQLSGYVPLCFSNLTSLRVLDVSHNAFTGNIPVALFTPLIHLEYISLSGNLFGGSFSFSSLANQSKLQVFQLACLSSNLYVNTEDLALPPPFQLKVLDLSGCNLNNGTHRIPSFLFYQKEIAFLDLSSNKLVGKIPAWLLSNNTNLKVLLLKNNSFVGPFLVDGSPKIHLQQLDISNNEVSGKVPPHIGLSFPNLYFLDLSRNSFEANIPQSLGNLTNAWSIDLSHNKFSGKVPDQIETGCFNLKYLILSNNSLHGYFPSRSTNLTSLNVLYLDNNYFVGSNSHGLSGYPLLESLDISNNAFQKIPYWIGNLSSLIALDMSANLLEGSLPDTVCKLQELEFLDLSKNKLIGPLPASSQLKALRFIHLHQNMISGSIPKMLFGSVNMVTLDLSYNNLSGGIPHYLGKNKELSVLLLGGNELQGHIPLHLCQLQYLTIMDLSQNKFSGPIPSCFGNISFGRYQFVEDEFLGTTSSFGGLGSNEVFNSSFKLYDFNADIDVSISIANDEVEFRTKSRTEHYAGNILNFMSGLDLSCNRLIGEIPPEFGDLVNIRALNLSHNCLQGSIPSRLSMLKAIESLDLSYNNFSGEIPSELTSLNFLSMFNVSYNNLSGRAPEKGQFANFDEANYRGNPGLCGPLLKRSCNRIIEQLPGSVGDEDKEVDCVIDVVAFTWSFFASYLVFIISLVVILCLSPYYRRAWSFYIDYWILSRFYEYCRSRSYEKRQTWKVVNWNMKKR